jgi:hypothetical protein
MDTTLNLSADYGLNRPQEMLTGPIYTKAQIRDQIKISRYSRVIESGEPVPWFSRVIEEISAGNYPGLLTLGHEFALSLGILNRVLDRMAPRVYQMDRMPLACELETLRLMLSRDAEELHLVQLAGEREISDRDVRGLFFAITGSNVGQAMKLVSEHRLDLTYKYVWEQGLAKFLENRYRVVKGIPEREYSRQEIIDTLTLPVIFDEAALIQRFTGEDDIAEGEGQDIRDQLALENAHRAEALSRINSVYSQMQAGEMDYSRLERALGEARMELEISNIQRAGIDALREYIRGQAVTGARRLALRYEFVCPTVSSDLSEAGCSIARSFYGQAQSSKKGSLYIRAEVLNNLRPFVASGECHRLPGNYMLALIRTLDGEEHYLICKQTSKQDQDAFNLRLLANFYFFEVPHKAVYHLLNYYMELNSGGIRTMQAVRKLIVASPIIIGLGGLVGVLYYIVFSQPVEGFMLGAGILLLGALIAAKNGYEEEINPVVHQKIPSYISRKNGRVTATTQTLDLSSLGAGGDSLPDDDEPEGGQAAAIAND